MKRDSSTATDASARISSQMPILDKVGYADYPLDNSGSQEELEERVRLLVKQLEDRAGWFWWRVFRMIPPLGLTAAIWCLGSRELRRWMRKAKRMKDE